MKEKLGKALETKRTKSSKMIDKHRREVFSVLNDEVDEINQQHRGWLDEFDSWLSEKLKKRSKEDIVKALQRVYKDITVHGTLQEATGEVDNKTDLDGESAILLLQECGFFNKGEFKKYFIHYGTRRKKGLHTDVGDTDGLDIQRVEGKNLFNSQLVLDHHPVGPASATYIVYKLLQRLGMIKEQKLSQIRRFVDFINIVDSRGYQAKSMDYPNSHNTLIGLQGFLPTKFIFNYFVKDNLTGFENMPRELLDKTFRRQGKKHTVKEVSEYRKTKVDDSIKQFNLAIKNSRVLNYKGKKFVVDIEGNMPNAMEVSSYHGYGVIRIYSSGDIQVYHQDSLDPKWANIGKLVRGNIFFVKKKKHNHREFWKQFNGGYFTQRLAEYVDGLNVIEGGTKKSQKKLQDETAIKKIEEITKKQKIRLEDLEKGKIYNGVIRQVTKFGAFINIGGQEGLLHKSDIDLPEGKKVTDLFEIGEELEVKLKEVKKIKGEKKPTWTL